MDGGIVAGVGEVTQIVFFKAQRFNLLPSIQNVRKIKSFFIDDDVIKPKLLSTLNPFGIINNISSKCLNDDLLVSDHYNLNILVTGFGRILLERTGNVETHPLVVDSTLNHVNGDKLLSPGPEPQSPGPRSPPSCS